MDYEYSHEGVKQSIQRYGSGLGYAEGWVEQMAEIAASKVDSWVETRNTFTENDIRRQVIIALEPLSEDLAYAYENYDKII